MEVLTALTMILLCVGIADYFAQQANKAKEVHDVKHRDQYNFLCLIGMVGLCAWICCFLYVQPWRLGIPSGGGVLVYHKDVPPDLSESEKIEKELEGMSDHKRWMFINDRVDSVVSDLDEIESKRITKVEKEVSDMFYKLRDVHEQVIRNESSLNTTR